MFQGNNPPKPKVDLYKHQPERDYHPTQVEEQVGGIGITNGQHRKKRVKGSVRQSKSGSSVCVSYYIDDDGNKIRGRIFSGGSKSKPTQTTNHSVDVDRLNKRQGVAKPIMVTDVAKSKYAHDFNQ